MLQVVWIVTTKLQQLSALFSRVTTQSQSLPTKIARRKFETNTRLLYTSDYCFKLDNAQTVCIRFFMVSKATQAFFQFEKPRVLLLLLIFDESDKVICQHGGKMQRLHQSPFQAIYSHQTTRLEKFFRRKLEMWCNELEYAWLADRQNVVKRFSSIYLFIYLKYNRKTRRPPILQLNVNIKTYKK